MLTQPKKSTTITARCTPSEREAIINRARRANKSVSAYLIGCAMHFAESAKPVARPPSQFLRSADGNSGA